MNLVRVINQVNICHSNLDPGCELAGGELVVGSSERIFSHRLPEGGSLPPPSLLPASFPPGLSLFLSLIVGGNRSPPLPASTYTHTHCQCVTLDSKAGSASDNGGSPYRTAAERGVQLGHVLEAALTYTGR